MRPAKRLVIPFNKCTERQAQLFKELAKEYIKTYNRSLTLDDLIMVMTPNPYVIELRNNNDVKVEKHLADFREILKLLKVKPKEAQDMDLTLNLATGDKIWYMLVDKDRMKQRKIELTEAEREFIRSFKW